MSRRKRSRAQPKPIIAVSPAESDRKPRVGLASGFSAGLVLGIFTIFALGALGDGRSEPGAPLPRAEPVAAGTEPRSSAEVTIAAVGDILLTRSITGRITAEGWEGPFRDVAPLLKGADIAFANLESPASYLGSPYPDKDPSITFRASPGALLGLKRAGFSIVSLANNHMTDFGPAAVRETIASLDTLGIAHCGAGRDEVEAHAPRFLEVKGLRFAFLAYVEPMWSVTPAGTKPGVAVIEEKRMVEDIRATRLRADFVVVSLHWGVEHEVRPRESDRALARRLVDAGAAAIIGHHPHVLQGAEFYRGAPIVYSLGNFIFDMISPHTYESAVAYLTFKPDGVRNLRFVPVTINRQRYAPARAVGNAARDIGQAIYERCGYLAAGPLLQNDNSVVLVPQGAYRSPPYPRISASFIESSSKE